MRRCAEQFGDNMQFIVRFAATAVFLSAGLAAHAQTSAPIRIGWMASLTGPLATAAIGIDTGVRFAVSEIDAGQLAALQQRSGRNLYLLDVRTPEEYQAGHLPGSRSAPGGQLVQS